MKNQVREYRRRQKKNRDDKSEEKPNKESESHSKTILR